MVVPVPKEGVELERHAQRTLGRLYRSVVDFWLTYLTLLFFGGALEAIRNATESWWADAAYWINMFVVTSFVVYRLGVNGPFIRTRRARDMQEVNIGLTLNMILVTPVIWLYVTGARELAALIARTTVVN